MICQGRLLLTTAVLLVLGASVVPAAVIDDFDTGGGVILEPVVLLGPVNSPAAGAIGGSRTLTASGISGGSTLGLDANLNNNGRLNFSLGPGTTGNGKVTWDANGIGLGGLDLTAGGEDRFDFSVLSIDQGGVDLGITIMTGGNSSSATATGLGVGDASILFSDFVGTADFTSVDSIMLEIQGTSEAADLTLDFFRTSGSSVVPEPTSVAIWSLIGLGLAGFGWLRMQRKK